MDARNNILTSRASSLNVRGWPVVCKEFQAFGSQAHAPLPALVQSMQPRIGDMAQKVLKVMASIVQPLLLFLFTFIVARLAMAFGHSAAKSAKRTFVRLADIQHGKDLCYLWSGRHYSSLDTPMPAILLGALGGLASAGILGMFVGATLLALGYQMFMWWVASNLDLVAVAPEAKPLD